MWGENGGEARGRRGLPVGVFGWGWDGWRRADGDDSGGGGGGDGGSNEVVAGTAGWLLGKVQQAESNPFRGLPRVEEVRRWGAEVSLGGGNGGWW